MVRGGKFEGWLGLKLELRKTARVALMRRIGMTARRESVDLL